MRVVWYMYREEMREIHEILDRKMSCWFLSSVSLRREKIIRRAVVTTEEWVIVVRGGSNQGRGMMNSGREMFEMQVKATQAPVVE